MSSKSLGTLSLLLWLGVLAGCAGPGTYGSDRAVPSSAKALLSFSVAGDPAVGVIDEAAHTGAITLAFDADLSNRVIRFTVSPKADTVPATGSNFTFGADSAVEVVAEDGGRQTYRLTAVRAVYQSSAKALLSFSVDGDPAVGVIDESAHTATITLASDAGLIDRTVRFSASPAASVSPASGSVFTFQAGSSVVVTAEDGSRQTYLLTALRAPSSACLLLGASFLNDQVKGTPDQTAKTLSLSVPAGTNLSAVIPVWTISAGAAVVPPTGTPVDFTAPVTVKVTAQDGTTQDYLVSLVPS